MRNAPSQITDGIQNVVLVVADGLGQHIPKGYIYFAMGFSVMVETINIRVRRHGPPFPPTKKP